LEDADLLGRPFARIVGTDRFFPRVAAFDADRLRQSLTFRRLGKLSSPGLVDELVRYVDALPVQAPAGARIRVEIPEPGDDGVGFRPSEVGGHQVVRRGPLECWEELVARCVRFGRRVTLASGPRLELLNAKAVMTEPAEEPAERLAERGFSLDAFHRYQRRILDPSAPADVWYTYGNRLRGYFAQGDTLSSVIAALRDDPESRHAYVALWDTSVDLPARDRATPCLTTLFFRASDGRLTLSTTFRAHNLLRAWLENVYGLMAIQRHVAEAIGMPPGSITVVSHSLGLDPRSDRFDLARGVAERWQDKEVHPRTGKPSFREDPHGHFEISLDRAEGRIVAEHRFGGAVIKRYTGRRAEEIEQQVADDMAVSLVAHALWLGRELARYEQRLLSGAAGTIPR